MRPASRKHRRLFAVGLLLACMVAWVLPAQVCFGAMAAVTQPACPHCPAPCCPDHCCATLAAACPASLQPIAAPALSLDKAVPAPALLLAYAPQPTLTQATLAPPASQPAYSSTTTVSIRFCSFQK